MYRVRHFLGLLQMKSNHTPPKICTAISYSNGRNKRITGCETKSDTHVLLTSLKSNTHFCIPQFCTLALSTACHKFYHPLKNYFRKKTKLAKRYPASKGFFLAWRLAFMKSFVSLGSCKVGLFDNLTNAKSHARKKPSLTGYLLASLVCFLKKFLHSAVVQGDYGYIFLEENSAR